MRARRCRGQAGETLVELLITVSILGIAVVAILTGLATAIRLSGTHRDQADAEVIVAAGAESVKNQAAYSCTPYSLADVTRPSGWSLTVTSIRSWNGNSFGATCTPSAKLQLVTIEAASPDGASVERLDVVKRDPS